MGGALDDIIGGVLSGKGGGLGGLLGGMLGGGRSGAGGGLQTGALIALAPVLLKFLSGGGLGKLLGGMQSGGLSAQADSWVGTGENQLVDSADVRAVVGDDELGRIAAEAGVSNEEAADGLSQLLPHVVDRVTPSGALPDQDELDRALAGLSG